MISTKIGESRRRRYRYGFQKKEETNTEKIHPLKREEVYSISKLYADCISGDAESCPVEVELRISLESSDWYKFQAQPFYQELMKYLDNLKTQKQNIDLGERKNLQEDKEFR